MPAIVGIARTISQNYGVKVVFRGDQAATDGKKIILPVMQEDITEDAYNAIQYFCDHESGHIIDTNFQTQRERLEKTEYNALIVHGFYNFLEDVRTEKVTGGRFFGVRQNFQRVWVKEMRDKVWEHYHTDPLSFQFGWALREKHTPWAPFDKKMHTPAVQWLLDWADRSGISARIEAMTCTADACQIAEDIVAFLAQQSQQQQQKSGDSSSEAQESGEGESESQDESQKGTGKGKGSSGESSGSEQKDGDETSSESSDEGNESGDQTSSGEQSSGGSGSKSSGKKQKKEDADEAKSDKGDSSSDQGDDEAGTESGDKDDQNSAGGTGSEQGEEKSGDDQRSDDATGTDADETADSTEEDSSAQPDDTMEKSDAEGDESSDSTDENADSDRTPEESIAESGEDYTKQEGQSSGEDNSGEGDSDGAEGEDEGSAEGNAEGGADGSAGGMTGDAPQEVKDAAGEEDYGKSDEGTVIAIIATIPNISPDDEKEQPQIDAEVSTGNPFGFMTGGAYGRERDETPPPDFTDEMYRQACEMVNEYIEKTLEGAGDNKYMAFRDNDKVRPADDRPDKYVETKEACAGYINVLAGKLQRELMAMKQSRWENNLPYGRLNPKSLPQFLVAPHHVNPFRVKTFTQELDVAVSLLIDNSGSMHGPKIEISRQCSIALHEALLLCQIPHEILGFTTCMFDGYYSGRRAKGPGGDVEYERTIPLDHIIYKAFEERTRCTKLGSVEARYENVDSEAVWWAASRLLARNESRKVLFVLCDGWPTGASPQERGNRHLKRVVEQATKSGIEVCALGIMSDSVKMFYPQWALVERIEDLAAGIIQTLRKALLKGERVAA